jgi:hypothetical protein
MALYFISGFFLFELCTFYVGWRFTKWWANGFSEALPLALQLCLEGEWSLMCGSSFFKGGS